MILIGNRRPLCFLCKFDPKNTKRKSSETIFIGQAHERMFKTGLKVLIQEHSDLGILAAILFLCKLKGQNVRLILVSTMVMMVELSTPKLTEKVIDTTVTSICFYSLSRLFS